MKKLFALALVVLGLAACQTDHSDLDVQFDGNATITLSIPADAVTRAGGSDSALSGLDNTSSETLRFILAVYDEYGKEKIRETQWAEEGTLTANFPVRLVPGRKYTFVAWADMVDAVDAGDKHYNTEYLTNITLKDEWNAMDETRDAFTASKTITSYSSTADLDMQLTRPFAKVRVITTDVADLKSLGLEVKKASVEYTTKIPVSYNAFEQKVETTAAKTHDTFDIADYGDDVDGKKKVLYTDYIFANDEQGAVKFSLTTYDQNDTKIKQVDFNTDIPVKRNMLTTLTGNVMTEGNNVSVEVKPDWSEEGGKHDITAISSYADILAAIKQGGEYLVLNDIDINLAGASNSSFVATRTGEEATEETTPAAGKSTTINLNGFTITVNNKSADAAITIPAGYTLVITGNGSINLTSDSKGAVFNNNEGTVVIVGGEFNDASENSNIFTKDENVTDYVAELKAAFAGELELENNTYTLEADVTLSETLTLAADKTLVLNLNGKTISQVKKCTGNYNMILNKGNLTITGNGKISFNDTGAGDPNFGWGSYTLRNEGTLVIENGTIEHLGKQNPGNGQPNVHMYCAIFQYSGTSTINGGTISTPTYRSARLWNGEMTINGGNFEGQLWLQAVSDNAKLTINGGRFAPRGNDGSSVFVSNSGKSVECAISGGYFEAKVGMSEPFGCIYGGEFTTAAKEATAVELIPDNYSFTELENGNWTVEKTYEWNVDNTELKIYGAAGLKYLADEVNKYSNYEHPFDGTTVLLENDINLNGVEWTPIGDYRFSANRFCGTFDGQEHTISNFKITKKTDKNDSNKSSYGFFGNVEGTIKNLTIAEASVNSYAYTGALAGRLNNGLIENCHVVDCTVSNTYWQGGILIGQVNAEGEGIAVKVKGCTVSNSSITSKSAIGAISGPVTTTKGGSISFENCTVNKCQIKQEGSFGGSYDNYFGSMFGYLEADENSSITIVNCTSVDTTVKGVADAPISGDFDGNITIDNTKYVKSFEALAAALKENKNVALTSNIEFSNSISISNANFTLEGNGHTITMAEGATNTYALFDITGGKATFKNVTFDGIKNGAVVRTVGVEFEADNVTAKNGQHTQQQGLFRLVGKSTIKNCTFENNTCSMVVTLNFDGSSDTAQVVENCVFNGNTCNGTAALYYVKGSGATINGNKFVGNTVNCTNNGATIYMGFQENCTVTNNLFQNNTVNESGESSRVAGGIFFGYDTVFTGNAFVGNKVTGTNAKGKDVCVSTYYTSIDLSDNYWGGNAPVEDTNYFVQHKSDGAHSYHQQLPHRESY